MLDEFCAPTFRINSYLSIFRRLFTIMILASMHTTWNFIFHDSGISDSELSTIQLEYKLLHREMQDVSSPADPSMLLVQ